MEKRRPLEKKRTCERQSRTGKIMAIAALALICIVGTSLYAQVTSRKKAKSSSEVSTMNLTTPSKEYIYAGSRLVATEEPTNSASPGLETIGLYAPATAAFFLRNTNSAGATDITFNYGPSGLTPLVGDWNGDGVDTIGLYDPAGAAFFLRNTNSAGATDITFNYGPSGLGYKPLVGDWNGL